MKISKIIGGVALALVLFSACEKEDDVHVDPETTQTSQVETNQGETNQGETNQGETNQGETSQGETNQGETNQGETNQGETNQEEVCRDQNYVDHTREVSDVYAPVCGCDGQTYDNEDIAVYRNGIINITPGPCAQ